MAASAQPIDEPITSINITPLVDVALVLVIIFMMTLPYILEKNLKVNASNEKAVPVGSTGQPILVEIAASSILVDGRAVRIEGLKAALARLIAERGSAAVAVSAAPGISHGRVVEVLDLVMASGANGLNLLEPQGGGHGAG